MKSKTPVFQQNNKKFNSSHSSEKSDKFSKKAPHFKENNSHFHKTKPARSVKSTPQISETIMHSARGDSKVKVLVKSTRSDERPYEKKTGPLSPRAPEKIKKNRAEEMKVYGENACAALFAQRPESIVRIWATVEMAKKSGELFRYLAENKKVYHVVDNAELALVSGTEHHGGICMLVKKARPFTLQGYLDIPRKQDFLLFIDAVQNAHNLGGVIRTCAAFNIGAVIVEQAFLDNLNSSAAMRVAEGGMEYVRVLATDDGESALQQLRQQGYQIVHLTSNKQATPLAKLAYEKKVVLVVNEQCQAHLAQKDDEQVVIALGSPLKAELNIAVATGILLSHWDNRS